MDDYAVYQRVKGVSGLFPASIFTVNGVKWGYINDQGHFVLPPIYNEAGEFQDNGLAIVDTNGKSGLINSSGYFTVPPKYEMISPFRENRAIVMDEKGFMVIDQAGNELTKKAYSYINDFHDDRAIFAGNDEQGNYLYGYLGRNGEEAIPLTYQSADDFIEDKAIVKIKDHEFALIDRNGRKLLNLQYPFVGSLAEGLMVFQNAGNQKFGYLNENGEIVIPAVYSGAQAFSNDRAVVDLAEGIHSRFGLIDKSGKLVISPVYNEILHLGSRRVALGQALDDNNPFKGSVYAIADTSGKVLSSFSYFGVSKFVNGLASAYDRENTFFIDMNGNKMNSLPTVNGSGTLTIINELIKANVDFRVSYFTRDGRVIWQQNTIAPLSENMYLKDDKYRPNKDYLVYYPQVSLPNNEVEQTVNQQLKEVSNLKKVPPNTQLDYSYYGNFTVPFYKKNLLVLEHSGYEYPFGAAHGMPIQKHVHVNLVTGQFYELKDLFKLNSHYVKVLSDIISNQIKADKNGYFFPDSYKGIKPDQPFYVTEDGLSLYFAPYEIAAFAAGFPTFTIPFSTFSNLINLNGPFWRSFHS